MISQIVGTFVGAAVGALTGAFVMVYSLLKVPGTVYEATESLPGTFCLTLPALLVAMICMFFAAPFLLFSNIFHGARAGANHGFVAACLYGLMHFNMWGQDDMEHSAKKGKGKRESENHNSNNLFSNILRRHFFAPISIGKKISASSISSEARHDKNKEKKQEEGSPSSHKRRCDQYEKKQQGGQNSPSSGRMILPVLQGGEEKKFERDGKNENAEYLRQLSKLFARPNPKIENDIRQIYKKIDSSLEEGAMETGEHKEKYNRIRSTVCPISNQPITQLKIPVTITFKGGTSAVYEYEYGTIRNYLQKHPGIKPFFLNGKGQIEGMFLGYPFEMWHTMQSIDLGKRIKLLPSGAGLGRGSAGSRLPTRRSLSP